MLLPQLKRIRWAVRAALFLGVAASVAANVLHARDNPISQAISAWPPLALLLTVELTSRIPMHKRQPRRAAGAGHRRHRRHRRLGVVLAHAGCRGQLRRDRDLVLPAADLGRRSDRGGQRQPGRAGRSDPVPRGAAGRAEGRRRRPHRPRPSPRSRPPVPRSRSPAVARRSVAPARRQLARRPATHAQALADGGSVFHRRRPRGQLGRGRRPSRSDGSAHAGLAAERPAADQPAAAVPTRQQPVQPGRGRPARPTQPVYVNGSTPPARPAVTRAAVSTPPRTIVTAATTRPAESNTPRQRRPVQETADLAAEIEAHAPRDQPERTGPAARHQRHPPAGSPARGPRGPPDRCQPRLSSAARRATACAEVDQQAQQREADRGLGSDPVSCGLVRGPESFDERVAQSAKGTASCRSHWSPARRD